jgi:hypothetical protein
VSHVPERRRNGDRRGRNLRAIDAERIDRLTAALDFCRSAIEACRDGFKVSRQDAEAVLRIIERARAGLWPDVDLLRERERALVEIRRAMNAAFKGRAANVSFPEVLDRLIVVARGSHNGS